MPDDGVLLSPKVEVFRHLDDLDDHPGVIWRWEGSKIDTLTTWSMVEGVEGAKMELILRDSCICI